jgi:hypothetical protein
LADEFGLIVSVTHYPAGASKGNPIEHRLFSAISGNWAGEPLVSYQTILQYIHTTRTGRGLQCRVRLDAKEYSVRRRGAPEDKAHVAEAPPHTSPVELHELPHGHGENQ